jgi:sugar O-acyltransferase (sialic acid O-acetyltransferase NeuD family)
MNIVIYGKGDFAKLMYYYFQHDSNYKVAAFCVDKDYIDADNFCDLPLIAFEDTVKKYPPENFKAFVAVGYSNMRVRKTMFDKIKNKGYHCINYISSKSIINDNAVLGENNVVLENTVIEPFVKIGDNNIIWASSNICHNAIIMSHSFIAAQSLIGGFSIIKNNCFLGFASTIVQNIVLEAETLVSAKSLMLKNSEKYSKYLGTPAKKVANHKKDGIKIK